MFAELTVIKYYTEGKLINFLVKEIETNEIFPSI